MHYFAYGSNLDAEHLRKRVGDIPPGRKAIAQDLALRFNKRTVKDDFGRANIVAREGSVVEGAVYELSAEQFETLDASEGTGYQRKSLFVSCEGALVEVYAYFAVPECSTAEDLPVSELYAGFFFRGAKAHGLSRDYIASILPKFFESGSPLTWEE